jgi:hypothetical protein
MNQIDDVRLKVVMSTDRRIQPQFGRGMTGGIGESNLHELPDDLKQRLVVAAREVELDHLPNLGREFRLSDNGNEL